MCDQLLSSAGEIERIAVFRPLHLGDMLCAVPALRALRCASPAAQITLIGLPGADELVRRFDYVDRVLPFPGFPGLSHCLPELSALPDFFRTVQASQFDLALQLYDDGVLANPLCATMGARRLAGFYPTGGWCPDPEWFTHWPERGPEVRRWLRLLQFLDIQACGEHMELPVLGDEQVRYAALAQRYCLQANAYACVSPGARRASRRWPPERFARVCDWLAGQGLAIVIAGTTDERNAARDVMACMRASAIDLTGATDLGMFAALVADARLMVCNDTGASQVAASVQTPSVVVCAGTDPEREAPLDAERHHLLHHPVICRPCTHRVCPFEHPCALAVSVTAVLQRARLLLQKDRSHRNAFDPRYAQPRVGQARVSEKAPRTHAS